MVRGPQVENRWSRTYFEIVTMAKVCPGRVWWLLQHFSDILHFKQCEIVMEKGIESHGKVMEKSWNFTEA